MKKVVLSLLAFGLVGAAAFAQDAPKVSIGEWGRQLFSFYGGKDASGNSAVKGALSASWWEDPRIVGLNINADGGNAGFSITPDADNGFGLTDQNKAWIKPMDGLTVESGINLETDTWRGIHDFGNWNWLRFGFSHNDSVTFSRLGEGGYATDVNYNKDGIGAWALLETQNIAYGGNTAHGIDSFGAGLQLGGAYTIKDIGQLKVQYLGNNVNKKGNLGSLTAGTTKDKQFGTYEVACKLSAVKGLYEELGLTIPSSGDNAGYTLQVADQVGYALSDAATVNAQIIYASYNDKNATTANKGKAGAGLAGGLGLDYSVGDGVGVSADLRYQNKLANNGGADTGDDAIGFTLGVTKGFANGLIGIAFEYATKGGFFGGTANGVTGSIDALGNDVTSGAWAIPIRIEHWF